MSLKSVEIIGYRGFKERTTVEFSIPDTINQGSGLTILTGPNNSGKSSILECLRTRSGYQNISFTTGTRNSSVEFVEIKFNIIEKKDSEEKERQEIIKSVAKGSSETSRTGIDNSFQIFVLPSRRAFNPYFSRNSLNREEYLHHNIIQSQRSSTLNNFEQRLFNILKSPENFNELLKEALGFDVTWTIDQTDQGQYFLKFFNGNHTHSSDGMGEGIVSIFSIIDSLYDSNPGSVIVIDEPELSLHPALQKRVKEILLRFSKDRQIIISTHSPYFIDIKALGNGAKIARVITQEGCTKVHQLSDESIKAIGQLSTSNLYNPHIFGLDAKELFFLEDKIILTEGQEDVLLFPSVFEKSNKPLSGNFFGWGAGGANNIVKICGILKDLGFSKVAAIFDGDKKTEARTCREKFPNYHFDCISADDIRTKPARKETARTEGLVDENYNIRPEHIEPFKSLASDLDDYLKT
ncbi:ATP-dependent nuclease [Pseudomonas oryzihabitans]|uniref:ATP-dependent nuclease n=1 Tax=Pseudomonas oryzihabitans TaxID=47885 RepID=UPI00119D42C3|nr:AAA family ATPase [Pseudomonas oryzihabitans]